jgi:hypothetical protein
MSPDEAVGAKDRATDRDEDAGDLAAYRDWKEREARGEVTYVPHEEARRRPNLPR